MWLSLLALQLLSLEVRHRLRARVALADWQPRRLLQRPARPLHSVLQPRAAAATPAAAMGLRDHGMIRQIEEA